MPKDAVTLREVAEAARVHPGTASRALNDGTRALVRPETVERVLAAANQLGYKPNLLARSFKTRRTNSVGIVLPDINNPLFPPMVRGLEDRLFQNGYVALLANTENNPDRQRRIFEGMADRRVDGLVLATAHRHDLSVAELAETGIPIVLLNRVVEGGRFSSVSVDDAEGIRLVVGHLRGLGHERVGHVAGPQSMSTGHARYQGFLASMEETGLPVDPRCVVFADAFSIAEGERCAKELLASRSDRPSAIIAGNDMLALGCYSALERAGLACPSDVSIVGFNDMPFIDRLSPPLTTVRIPHYELGVHAAELLLWRLRDPETPVQTVHLAPHLVERGSTASARRPAASPGLGSGVVPAPQSSM
ncbi:MAG TPA: LacI family DNA-binding transcriptional regulator [Acidimicrobiales bacterium]|nr:LacI family DNA-binding transcriptional regulator [Acidimicrobiales bacterium]